MPQSYQRIAYEVFVKNVINILYIHGSNRVNVAITTHFFFLVSCFKHDKINTNLTFILGFKNKTIVI